jgi:hypothetical protein
MAGDLAIITALAELGEMPRGMRWVNGRLHVWESLFLRMPREDRYALFSKLGGMGVQVDFDLVNLEYIIYR